MNILVVGCGKIGSTIVASLTAEGHNVTAVDSNRDILEEITNIHDVMGVCGNGADCETLTDAGVAEADMFVAATGSDELNMLACYLASKMGARHTIARIRNPEYNDKSLGFMKQELELSMAINPDMLAARELFHTIKLPSAAKIETFSRGHFEMIELHLKATSPLIGVPLHELRSRYAAKFLICVVQRGDEVFIPNGMFVLQAGDRIGLTASPQEIQKLMRGMGSTAKKAKNVMILGGSRTAYYLAKRLCAAGTAVKIIDRDRAKCEALCDALPKAVIIHGDGSDQELLLEEGLDDMDAFVALTGMDEQNILFSFFAASQNVPAVIPKINRRELSAMATKLGLDCIISPRKLIADVVVRYARALQNSVGSTIETLYTLMDDKAEAIELLVQDEPRLLNIPLKDLSLKKDVLIAGIIRDRKPIIPTGDDCILAGDKVVLIAAKQHLRELGDILA